VHQDPFQPFRRDSIDELIDFLTPAVESILARVNVDEFTTPDFIEALRSDPEAERTYQEAIRRWGEDEHSSKLVIHGQVIPGVLRKSRQVRWSGFAHDVADEYAVPAWWTMTRDES
jgi:hypothetical protein